MDNLDWIFELLEMVPLGVIIAIIVGVSSAKKKKANKQAAEKQPPAYHPMQEESSIPQRVETQQSDIWSNIGNAVQENIGVDITDFVKKAREAKNDPGNAFGSIGKEIDSFIGKAQKNAEKKKKPAKKEPPVSKAPAPIPEGGSLLAHEGLHYEGLHYEGLQTEMREGAIAIGPGSIAAQASDEARAIEKRLSSGKGSRAVYISALDMKVDANTLRQGMVMKEILDRPRAARRMAWRSRY